jgi:predicted Zn-dependent protease
MFHFVQSLRLHAGILALVGTTAMATGCAAAISTQDEAQLGAQAASQYNSQLPIVQDAAVNRYVNQLGNRIASAAPERRFNYTFYVVNSNVVNAFAIPGGYVYINRGLIERAANESELAGVLGHEIGHVVLRHGVEQMAKMQQAELGVNLAYILLGRVPGQLEQLGLQVGGAAYFARNSREAENEADEMAVQLVTRAGINPEGVVTFFQKLLNEQKRNPNALEQFFSTHPLTQDRINHTQRLVEAIPASQRRNLETNTTAFQHFKSRDRQLPAPRQ